MGYIAILIPFNVKYLFATNNVLRGMRRHKIPCPIFKKSIKFIFHFMLLERILNSLKYTIGRRMLGGKVELFGFENVVAGTGDHKVGLNR